MTDPDEQRAELAERWELAAAGWGRQADAIADAGRPVSDWMVDHLVLEPGQRVLELAAGPGDTGFLAAERVAPGTLVSSDLSEGMLEIARRRAEQRGVPNVAFAQRQLEWIDEPTASFDAVLCRWGLMLCLDPAAALVECRRVLRPGGRIALAVWDVPEANPWLTVPSDAIEQLAPQVSTAGAAASPGVGSSPGGAASPGAFALADRDRLAELIADAGFLEVAVEPVGIARTYDDAEGWLEETLDSSWRFTEAWRALGGAERAKLLDAVSAQADPFRTPAGGLSVPGRCLCASAEA